MTNEQKYKTPEERTKALNEFCLGYTDCKRDGNDCPCFGLSGNCAYNWLALEAEEKPLPCPFCGGEAIVAQTQCVCKRCGVATIIYDDGATAIAAWNRRVK